MAKSSADRSTIDLFSKSRGRPRTHLLSRQEQLKVNKKVQRLKEKQQGLKRIEVTLDQNTIEQLDTLCEMHELKRADWVTKLINLYCSEPSNQSKIKKYLKAKALAQRETLDKED